MRVGFILTSPYQLFHFERMYEHFSSCTAYLEVRDQDFGLTRDLVSEHLPGANIVWISSRKLASIDGQCDVLVCQTPVPLMHFYSKSLVVAQQYSLAKERYQYGVWRTQANMNLMYGEHSTAFVSGFANAVAVGNPLLDKAFAGGRVPVPPCEPSGKLRVLYMPTYGDLSNKEAAIHKLLTEDVSLSIKLHHAEAKLVPVVREHGIAVFGSEIHPINAILEHDVVVSDYSGAIFDALAVRRPVVVTSDLNEQSRDTGRLSADDKSRSDIESLICRWTEDVPFKAAYEQARDKLVDQAAFEGFLHKYFVNLGRSGEACANEIVKLVKNGEPENFSVQQVREANRRYILKNRKIRAKLAASEEAARKSLQVSTLMNNPPRVAALKIIRWGLYKSPGGEFLLKLLRQLRRRGVEQVSDHAEEQREVPFSLSPVPAVRRKAMLSILERALRAHGVDFRTEVTQANAYCAVNEADLDQVYKVLHALCVQFRPAELRIWFGRGGRYDRHCSADSIGLTDIVECQSLVIGMPYRNMRYSIGRRGGVEILFVEPRDSRLVAKRWLADKVDWTKDFRTGSNEKNCTNGRARSYIGRTHALEGEPIDVVYTWVDSGDEEWQETKTVWASRQNIELDSAGNEERYLNRDELRYSLRSIWLYAPFVRNIFIVTAGHRPEWLDLEKDGIFLVPHQEIFPDLSNLPTFNSHAIEACLHRIPGLSENFIYFNDDVFLGRESKIDTFYSKAGLIKSRFSPSSFTAAAEPDASAIPTDWASYNAVRLIAHDFGLFFDRKMKHIPMPMKRSLLQEIEERYPDLIGKTRASQFRSRTDISLPSMLAHFYGVATGKAVEVDNKPGEYAYADTGRRDFRSRLKLLDKRMPMFLCLNVTRYGEIARTEQTILLQDFLKAHYPVPSPFELDIDRT